MNIMDGKESSTLTPEQFAAVAAGTAEPAKEPVKKQEDVNLEGVTSSVTKPDSTKADEKSAESEETPEVLKAKIEGLTAELARIRKSRTDSSERVEALERDLKAMQTQLKGSKEHEYTDEEVVQLEADWTDELAEARLDLRDAKREGNTPAIEAAEKRVGKAKVQLRLAKSEIFKRTQDAGLKRIEERSEEQGVADDIAGMYADLAKAYPDLRKEGSELWKASQAEYKAMHPGLRKRLGSMDELVAAQRAIAKNPDLVKSVDRKALLKEIEDAQVSQSTKVSATAPARKGAVDYSSMSAAQMENLIQKVISGAA